MMALKIRHLDTGYMHISLDAMRWAQFPTREWAIMLRDRHIPRQYVGLERGWAESVAASLERELPAITAQEGVDRDV